MIRWQLPRVRLWLGNSPWEGYVALARFLVDCVGISRWKRLRLGDSSWRYVAHGLLKVPGGNIAAGTLFVTWRWVA
jgi:hypothetical protein